MRSADDEAVTIVEALEWQLSYVREAGSPVAGLVLAAAIADVEAGGELASLLPSTARFGDLIGLRVMAALHRLALQRRAPAVALHLPTLGGTPPEGTRGEGAFRRAAVAALTSHPEELRESLGRTPQTNETGRAALLRCALSQEDPRRGVRLREIGASAGLNLRADQLPGDPGLELGPLPVVVDRVGCDLDPVDISTPEGRALLGSYVWVDDVDRFARLSRAMDVAARVPAEVLRMDAVDFAATVEAQEGTTTVLWHSAMWIYLRESARTRILSSIAHAGERAGPDRPLVHVSWEWDPGREGNATFTLVARRWDGGAEDGRPRLLASGMSHGTGLRAAPAGSWLAADPLVTAGA